tara:strand:- start:395 stop:634 length:240 start_codon:yes stop_codon:yes gene_type:complete
MIIVALDPEPDGLSSMTIGRSSYALRGLVGVIRKPTANTIARKRVRKLIGHHGGLWIKKTEKPGGITPSRQFLAFVEGT